MFNLTFKTTTSKEGRHGAENVYLNSIQHLREEAEVGVNCVAIANVTVEMSGSDDGLLANDAPGLLAAAAEKEAQGEEEAGSKDPKLVKGGIYKVYNFFFFFVSSNLL